MYKKGILLAFRPAFFFFSFSLFFLPSNLPNSYQTLLHSKAHFYFASTNSNHYTLLHFHSHYSSSFSPEPKQQLHHYSPTPLPLQLLHKQPKHALQPYPQNVHYINHFPTSGHLFSSKDNLNLFQQGYQQHERLPYSLDHLPSLLSCHEHRERL